MPYFILTETFNKTNSHIVVTATNKIVIKKQIDILQSDLNLFNIMKKNNKICISFVLNNKLYYFGVRNNIIIPVESESYFDVTNKKSICLYNGDDVIDSIYYNGSAVLVDHEQNDLLNLQSGVALSIYPMYYFESYNDLLIEDNS